MTATEAELRSKLYKCQACSLSVPVSKFSEHMDWHRQTMTFTFVALDDPNDVRVYTSK